LLNKGITAAKSREKAMSRLRLRRLEWQRPALSYDH
jgi:hypothetical protein